MFTPTVNIPPGKQQALMLKQIISLSTVSEFPQRRVDFNVWYALTEHNESVWIIADESPAHGAILVVEGVYDYRLPQHKNVLVKIVE